MTSFDDVDIVVAGAGLSGSMTALLLAKRGFKVLVVEKSSDPREVAKMNTGDDGYGTSKNAIRRRFDIVFLHNVLIK